MSDETVLQFPAKEPDFDLSTADGLLAFAKAQDYDDVILLGRKGRDRQIIATIESESAALWELEKAKYALIKGEEEPYPDEDG
jgi:hypothetical protein